MEEDKKKIKGTKRGVVVSNKGDKSAVASVETVKVHKIYKKRMNWSKKYMFHDEQNACNVGDVVDIIPSRPMSKKKRYALHQVIQKADKE